MKRHATAVWEGSFKEGNGKISLESKVLVDAPYSYKARFEDGKGTNPEELIAAAHAGCFTMQLTAYISEAGFKEDFIETTCYIDFQDGAVVSSHLKLKAKIDGISNEEFQSFVTKAEKGCPISKLLNTEISSEATLL